MAGSTKRRKDVSTPHRQASGKPELWNLLKLDADGTIDLDGLRIVLLPASTLTDIQAAGERILGRGLGSIFYDAGKRTGRDIADYVRRMVPGGAIPMDAVLQVMEAGHRDRGYGLATFVSHDLAVGSLVVCVRNSPYAQMREGHGTACYFPLGFWVGLVESISGKPVNGKETQCASDGHPYCEFVVTPA